MSIAVDFRGKSVSRGRGGASGLSLALGLGLALLVAGGCVDDETAALIANPATHHPIGYGASPETLIVEVPSHGGGLSRNQQADVYRFLERYKAESTGNLRIEAPGAASQHFAISRSMRQVEEVVQASGIDPGAIEVSRTGGKNGHAAAVSLTYDRTVALPPECGDWSDDLGKNRNRLPYNNFGCASQRNLALTVANGRDLQGPQQETPRSSERRSTTWSEYIGASAADNAATNSTGPTPTTK
ncbi:MAG: CpaD family pilus assembly protein [Hyphomicrobium sp.]